MIAVVSFFVVLDCSDPVALAGFWSQALRYEVAEHEEPYVVLRPSGVQRSRPMLLLQRVPEPKTTKNRMHIDLRVADIEAEATRLVEAGATRLGGERGQSGWRWIVMADPEGNELCVCRE